MLSSDLQISLTSFKLFKDNFCDIAPPFKLFNTISVLVKNFNFTSAFLKMLAKLVQGPKEILQSLSDKFLKTFF